MDRSPLREGEQFAIRPVNRARTKRSERSQAALIRAAHVVFNRRGFADAKISEIVEGAQLAHGSFYTHFDSKEDIFVCVLIELLEESITVTGAPAAERDLAPIERIEATNRRYLEFYSANARILASIEPLAGTDARVARLRRDTRRAYIARTAAAIHRWQKEGRADPTVDADALANVLGSMVERVAYLGCVFEDGPGDVDETLQVLNHVWSSALGLAPATRTDAGRETRRIR